MVFFGINFRYIVSKEGKLLDPKKIQVIMNMFVPQNSQQIQVFNGMEQFYTCFIKNFVVIMVPTTKLTRKTNHFLWMEECQKTWELIKQKYIEVLILIPPKWDVEFHVHTYASLLVVGAGTNITRKSDQSVVCVFFNHVEQNYNTTKRKALKLWFLHFINLSITYWEVSLCFMLII